jgi:hypothetical protein
VSGLDGPEKQTETYLERLSYARIEGPGVTLAYMADDKTHVIILMANRKSSDDLTGSFSSPSHTTERRCGSASPVSNVGFDGQWNLGICICHYLLRARASSAAC